MEGSVFASNILQMGLNPITPCREKQKEIGKLIYPNLENGVVVPRDKKKMIAIIHEYCNEFNVDAVLLGCTELPFMIHNSDVNIPIINTTKLHIEEIFKQSLLDYSFEKVDIVN